MSYDKHKCKIFPNYILYTYCMNKNYWATELPEPYCPSISDVDIYKNNMKDGTTLLLGCTHKLIPFTTLQLDIDPWYDSKSVVIGDWRDNKTYFDNIIGDGVFNFTEKLTNQVLEMASKYCGVLIVRCFNKKLPNMKIANHFPKIDEFPIKVNYSYIFEDYNFFIWKFDAIQK